MFGSVDATRTLSVDTTWIDPGIPYVAAHWIRVQGPVAGPTATLTLELTLNPDHRVGAGRGYTEDRLGSVSGFCEISALVSSASI